MFKHIRRANLVSVCVKRDFFWGRKKEPEVQDPPKSRDVPKEETHAEKKPFPFQAQHGSKLPKQKPLPGIKHVVVVASGKGGVGKSTVATNLALAFSKMNKSVGILDADIYGPSIHRMMNVPGRPEVNDETNKMIPKSNYGVKVLSMGNLIEEDAPTIWRGPLVMGALDQLLRQVEWGELDILVMDFPPGTGDVQLSTAQNVSVSGAVVVSTPQDIALIDARRGTNMFRKVGIDVLGVVENMSYHICTNCGNTSHIFGHGGARETAKEMELDFLGEIPLNAMIRENSDKGTPPVMVDPNNVCVVPFLEIAQKILQKLDEVDNTGPKIIIE
ncbi:Nubpl [Acrasis kona]|uniref:Nucleotide-binding protein-like n=1 Tax=Acrasis kona TaxID=1008807 RepID=A0AAW2ZDP6_9EUKA